jgi:uncharacterized protein YyaL (SSP411 family)
MGKNLLHLESSPYLLQHADNPVHWQPWGVDALAAAKSEDKPIMLSVGYAACHWCHVMAHESFEDADVAAILNEHFIAIKVDREERPDIDTIYQHSLMLLGQHGGWPLTMFLTPDGEPFWGGTYFPPEGRFGRPGFPDVLQGVVHHYREKPEAVTKNVAALRDSIAKMGKASAGGAIALETIDGAARRLAQEFDSENGGIGSAPKFPNPAILELLWRTARRTKDAGLRDTVTLTLDAMSQGGIYDHLGGGYARYSTDDKWLVPHFEKMLYDNAQIMDLLTWGWQGTESALYAARVSETADWVLREMTADGGGFAATLDADSEGEEGRFYVWTGDQIDEVLGDDSGFFKAAYDVSPEGNWEGKTILNRTARPELLGDAEEVRLEACRAKLLAERDKRVRPGWDDKVLADWNGLMIAAMANAAAAFGEPRWHDAAVRAFDFVCTHMTQSGRLFHAWRGGQLKHTATLDDYANMIRAALVLHEAGGDDKYLAAAREWIAVLDAHYWDADGGGYFFTADDAEALIVRTKSAADNATPAGNGVIAAALARLALLTGEDAWRKRAEAVIAAFAGEVAQNFFPLTTLMNSAELLSRAVQCVVIGARGDTATMQLIAAARAAAGPAGVMAVIAPDTGLPAGHPASGKGQLDGKPTAYICIGETCSLPLTDAAAIADSLLR